MNVDIFISILERNEKAQNDVERILPGGRKQVAKIASQDHVAQFISMLLELYTASLFLKTQQ